MESCNTDRHLASSPPGEQRKREERNDTRADPLLPEQRRGWSLMIVLACATYGLEGSRWRRAVEDPSAPIHKE